MNEFAAEIKRQQSYADWMEYRILRWCFSRFVFKTPDDIVLELLENPPAPFKDIMSHWTWDDDINREWARVRAHIRIIRYYNLRSRWYPHYPFWNLGDDPYPSATDMLADYICDHIEIGLKTR